MPESKSSNTVADIAWIVAAIGALNWGLIGFFNFNLVDAIFGGGSREATSAGSRIIYAVVGICAIIGLVYLPRMKVHRARQTLPTT
ncbi:MAG: DUF378 domain-containing protein [Kofleriaceae bacterium]